MSTEASTIQTFSRSDLAGKYLTFKLGAEEYGLEILKVQEIIKMMEITHVPRTPEYVCGVINLRGKVIPVINLRSKFSLNEVDQTEKTCIIVVQLGEDMVTMGIVVDEVSEVLDIAMDDIEPPPSMGASVENQFLLGMAKTRGTVKILLDVDKVLSVDDIAAVESVI
ncbi:MAG: purine-binding chemotaxis protein CheW [Spartobacteria bacterium]|nr:purine-binding chemotaxis protein CheW [Spartobacteria bacterium]